MSHIVFVGGSQPYGQRHAPHNANRSRERSVVCHTQEASHLYQHSWSYYSLCLAGGVLSSTPRWFQTPLDVIKVQMQVNPQKYPNLVAGLQTVWRTEGVGGLYRGLGPTALAYAVQTGGKYALYEYFKSAWWGSHPEQHQSSSSNSDYQKMMVYMLAAASAEAVADIFMCPLEALKVRVQTGRVQSTWRELGNTLAHPQRAWSSSLGALWARQVPGTMVNMVVFERTVQAVYESSLFNSRPKQEYAASTQLGVTLFAGYAAGLCSALASHPADVLLSHSIMHQQSKSHHNHAASLSLRQHLSQLGAQVGWWRLVTAGLGTRVLMTGNIIGMQWLIYDSFKAAAGLGTTGGK